jgi:hypothetical protein
MRCYYFLDQIKIQQFGSTADEHSLVPTGTDETDETDDSWSHRIIRERSIQSSHEYRNRIEVSKNEEYSRSKKDIDAE